jgi:hypothetical protein
MLLFFEAERKLAMKKFLVLYHAPISASEQMAKATPEQAKAGMDLWMNWSKKNAGAIVDLGAPLGRGKNVQARSASDSKSTVAGYSLLQCEPMDAATKAVADHPHFHTPGGPIEILEFLPMPGM